MSAVVSAARGVQIRLRLSGTLASALSLHDGHQTDHRRLAAADERYFGGRIGIARMAPRPCMEAAAPASAALDEAPAPSKSPIREARWLAAGESLMGGAIDQLDRRSNPQPRRIAID